MTAPIVFISRWRVREGKGEAVEAMFAQGVELIASTKPRTALFAAYLDEAGAEVRFVHAVPDAAAMIDHLAGSAERSGPAFELMEFLGYEVYGDAPAAAIDQLRAAAVSSRADLRLLPVAIGGYLRAPN